MKLNLNTTIITLNVINCRGDNFCKDCKSWSKTIQRKMYGKLELGKGSLF